MKELLDIASQVIDPTAWYWRVFLWAIFLSAIFLILGKISAVYYEFRVRYKKLEERKIELEIAVLINELKAVDPQNELITRPLNTFSRDKKSGHWLLQYVVMSGPGAFGAIYDIGRFLFRFVIGLWLAIFTFSLAGWVFLEYGRPVFRGWGDYFALPIIAIMTFYFLYLAWVLLLGLISRFTGRNIGTNIDH